MHRIMRIEKWKRGIYMLNLLGAGVGFFDQLISTFSKIGSKVPIDYVFIGAIGLLIAMFIVAFILIRSTYEFKIDRNVKKINAFLTKNPVLTDENLVEINKKFKQVPKTFRSAWQEYVLNRDKLPSEYMSTLRCVVALYLQFSKHPLSACCMRDSMARPAVR